MTDDKTRAEFEELIKSSPFEHMCDRNGDNSAWPGHYKRYETQLAWDVWQAAKERYGQSWLSVYESEPPQGVRALFMERGTEHVICSFPHRRLWEEQGHDLWMPIPATKEQKHEQ